MLQLIVLIASFTPVPSAQAGIFNWIEHCAGLLKGRVSGQAITVDPRLDVLPDTFLQLPADALTKVYGADKKRQFALLLSLARPGTRIRASLYYKVPRLQTTDLAERQARAPWYTAVLARQGIKVVSEPYFLKTTNIRGNDVRYDLEPYDSLAAVATMPIEAVEWAFRHLDLISFSLIDIENPAAALLNGFVEPVFSPMARLTRAGVFFQVPKPDFKAEVSHGRISRRLAAQLARMKATEDISVSIATYRGALPQIYALLEKHGGRVMAPFPGRLENLLTCGYLRLTLSKSAAYALLNSRFVEEMNYPGRTARYQTGLIPGDGF